MERKICLSQRQALCVPYGLVWKQLETLSPLPPTNLHRTPNPTELSFQSLVKAATEAASLFPMHPAMWTHRSLVEISPSYLRLRRGACEEDEHGEGETVLLTASLGVLMSPHTPEAGSGSQLTERGLRISTLCSSSPLLGWLASSKLLEEGKVDVERWARWKRRGRAGHFPFAPTPPQIHSLLCSVPWDPWKRLHPLPSGA